MGELGCYNGGDGGRPLLGVVFVCVLSKVRAGRQAVSRVVVSTAAAPIPSLELCLGLRPMLCGEGGGVGVVVLFPSLPTWPPPALAPIHSLEHF